MLAHLSRQGASRGVISPPMSRRLASHAFQADGCFYIERRPHLEIPRTICELGMVRRKRRLDHDVCPPLRSEITCRQILELQARQLAKELFELRAQEAQPLPPPFPFPSFSSCARVWSELVPCDVIPVSAMLGKHVRGDFLGGFPPYLAGTRNERSAKRRAVSQAVLLTPSKKTTFPSGAGITRSSGNRCHSNTWQEPRVQPVQSGWSSEDSSHV
jgi:hypothetical protein